jgi:hypothetical protein
MRYAFRTYRDCPASREQTARFDKRFRVSSNIGSLVLTPVNRERVHRTNEEADNRHPKQGLLRQKRHGPRRETENKDRIDQPVRVIENENNGLLLGNPIQADDFDAAEEDPQRELQD